MKTAKWTFNINSQAEFAAFYVSLVDFWLSHGNRPSAISAIRNIARETRVGRQLLNKCLPYLRRDIMEGSSEFSSADRRSMVALFNEMERAVRSKTISKVYISLPKRGSFRSTTTSPLREVGAPQSHDRRHIIADFFTKHFIQELLNSLPDGETQCDYLAEVGCDPDNFGGSIQLAARKWQLNMFNHLDNLFMGPGAENRVLGARGVAIDPAPWQSGLYQIIRRDLSDIVGTRYGGDQVICRDIEEWAIQALMKERIA